MIGFLPGLIRLALLLLAATPLAFARNPMGEGDTAAVVSGTVTRVVDGDTIDVQLSSGLIRVRLYGIDAPEHNQRGGPESTAALQALIGGKRVDLDPYSQDRYDRMIADVYLGEMDAGSEMVRSGHAWAFRKYMKREDTELCTLEAEARSAHRGLWSGPGPQTVAPWEFRHRAKLEGLTDYSRETVEHCIATIGSKGRP